jgi:transcriptional regulator with XRE-family HTH domain
MTTDGADTTARQRDSPEAAVRADVGTRIRAARRQRGWTLEFLGGGKLSRSFLSLVENGKASPSLRTLIYIARRLNVSVAYLVSGGDETAEEAVELALELADAAVRGGRAEECLSILDEIVPLPQQEAQALHLRGWALLKLGQAEGAIPALRESLGLQHAVNRPAMDRGEAETLYLLAVALYQMNRHGDAIETIAAALPQHRSPHGAAGPKA